MSKTRFVLTAIVVISLCVPALYAVPVRGAQPREADLDILLNAIRANRKAFVAANIKLTDEEASKFWPLYERYQKEAQAIGDRQAAAIQDYITNFRTLSSEKAMQLMETYLTTEADRVKLRRTYLEEFAKILPGRTVARFYQLENKMDAVLRYALAAKIPVVDQPSGVPAR